MFSYRFINKNRKEVKKIKSFFEESVKLEYFNKKTIRRYQKENIKKILRNIKNIPFYSKQFKNIQDFKFLPIINKKIIFNNFHLMQNRNKCNTVKFQNIETSGTSGIKGRFLRTEDDRYKWFAHTLKIWFQNNVSMEKKHAFITNRLSENPRKNKSYFSTLIKNCNHVALSIFCNLDSQIEWLRKEKPSYLTTFPSNLEHLFNKGYIPKVEHIFTYGEPLNPEFQKKFENQVKITDSYSTTEAGIIAQQCKYNNYHINSDNYFVEILTDKKQSQPKIGKIIITIFSNQILPLVRYDIGDYAYVNRNGMCKCGRKSEYFRMVVGREINQLQSKSGEKIWANEIIDYLRKIKSINKFQINQNEPNSVTIYYVGEIGYLNDKKREVKNKLEKIIGNNINLKIKKVKDIKREKSGKFHLIINNI